jgi:hypothetical protein
VSRLIEVPLHFGFHLTTALPQYVAMQTSQNVVQTPNGDLYIIATILSGLPPLVSTPNLRLVYLKSTDGGRSWSNNIALDTSVNLTQVAVWYDRWSGINSGLIHVAYVETGGDMVKYISIDTENSDTISTVVNVFDGASTAAGGWLTITRARGGNLAIVYNIDAGVETGFSISTDVGATWNSFSNPTEAVSNDQFLLFPGWGADDQDLMLFYWDSSDDEISVKYYDNSADTWSETSIAASMVDVTAASGNPLPHMTGAVDLANSQNILVAWSAVDTANADLRCWTVTQSSQTEVTNVVQNSGDDQGLVAMTVASNGDWYVYYGGKSDGSETYPTAMKPYYKVSVDQGSTWSAEMELLQTTRNIVQIYTFPVMFAQKSPPMLWLMRSNVLELAMELQSPKANYVLGV